MFYLKNPHRTRATVKCPFFEVNTYYVIEEFKQSYFNSQLSFHEFKEIAHGKCDRSSVIKDYLAGKNDLPVTKEPQVESRQSRLQRAINQCQKIFDSFRINSAKKGTKVIQSKLKTLVSKLKN